ncbi:thiosulfate oxidation carrier complex protein SoxZ [Vineibacter terrae]|uniref:thiosulfate oxidation carrier complex protein SoxZ n=1 Tax=Vineibacter terrae TaxID=2586908 RepID=UPI002E33724F|nr:thiosulfate oxidation carrier complex protein SoxZ [Vineibacter terrae]HEX2891872.1 thiosulfate oxidation carrier complex protein SoxZ [Vineibacter terrae]
MGHALINVPAAVKRGEAFEIKALIAHPMETGFRPGPNGVLLPRNIIQRFTCTYNGVEVFSLTLSPAIAANPYIAFFTVATESGSLTLRWTGDKDFMAEETVPITVTA